MPPVNKGRGDRIVTVRGVEGKLPVDILRRAGASRPHPSRRLSEHVEAVIVDESHTEPLVEYGGSVRPAVRVVCNERTGLFRAVPVGLEDAWTQASGAFIHTSDSRLFEVTPYPIPLHDQVGE